MRSTRRKLLAALGLGLGATALPRAFAGEPAPVNAGPYVPTPQYIVDRMLNMARVSQADYVIDLGSGDGRIVTTAAKAFGARGLGVDINERLVELASEIAHKEGVYELARFERRDVFRTDLTPATVLTLYLLPQIVLDLRPKILNELRPGSRVVTHDYHFADWTADDSVTFDSPEKVLINGSNQTSLYYYLIPARVAGRWRISLPDGFPQRTVEVTLRQVYQRLQATIEPSSQRLPRADLAGDRITLELVLGTQRVQVQGTVRADRIEAIATAGARKGTASAVLVEPGVPVGWQQTTAR